MPALLIVVVGMVNLHANHAAVGHPFDQLVGHGTVPLPHRGVREDTHPAGGADQREGVKGRQRVLRDVGDATVGDEPVERLAFLRDDARLHHRLRDVWPCDQVIAGDRAHPLERDVVAEVAELLDHELAPSEPRVGQTPELLDEGGIGGIGPVRQDVQRRAVMLGRELDTGNDREIRAGCRGRRFRVAGRRVVIGDRDPLEAALERERHVLRHGVGAVGFDGVGVQVDPGHREQGVRRSRPRHAGRTRSRWMDPMSGHPAFAIALTRPSRRK
jgi:hypothetical protein